MKAIIKDRFLSLALLCFSLLFIPYLFSFPFLDGEVDFFQCYDFFKGGLYQYLQWHTVHPPGKVILVSLLFHLLGVSSFSYNILGLLFGILGIIAMYHLTNTLFDKFVARMSTLLLALSPLYLSTGLFLMRDYMITILILLALLFFLKKQWRLYAFVSFCGAITKEPFLILPLSILIYQCVHDYKNHQVKKNLNIYVYILLPFICIVLWWIILYANGGKIWSENIYTNTAAYGPYYTIIYNFLTFRFLNISTYQNWLQLLFFNFNWVFAYFITAGVIVFIRKQGHKKLLPIEFSFICITLLFVGLFSLSVLTIQTFAVARYALPLYPFIFIGVAKSLETITRKNNTLRFTCLIILGSVVFMSLFYSIDPISRFMWGTTTIYSTTFYGNNNYMAGNDGITYNMQYLHVTQKRTIMIQGNILYNKNLNKSDEDTRFFHILDKNLNKCSRNTRFFYKVDKKLIIELGLKNVVNNSLCANNIYE